MGRTLLDKVWETHVVRRAEGIPDLLYVDLHLVHEVTSPQAFEGLRLAGRRLRRPPPPPRGPPPPGLGGLAPRRPPCPAPRPDARDDGPQRRHWRRHADGS